MKICAILLLISCTITLSASEYSRFKRRGMPGPPRPPPYPQYVKKWQQPHPHHRNPPPRPSQKRHIPVHMPVAHKIPLGIPHQKQPIRPVASPVRAFWKNTQTTFKTPIIPEKPIYHHVPFGPEKSNFLSSPSIPNEYDFQIQTNSIPTHHNPIKQVGEKGPIHTIPAPNLSLADKPIMVDEVKHHHHHQQQQQQQQQQHHQQQQQLQQQQQQQLQQQHQQQQQQQQELQQLHQQQQEQQQTYVQIQNSHQYHVTESPEHKHKTPYHIQGSPPVLQPQEVAAADFYQLLNAYQQPQNAETYNIPTLQEQYLQVPQQSAQLFQPDQNYIQQIQNLASDKSSINPEMHSFNYNEQENRQQSSQVTSAYSVEPSAEASETVHSTIARNNPLDSMAQSQYVQNYFDTREEQTPNRVDPVDAKPSREEKEEQEAKEEQSAFYTSLPNKQAADALASLQAAGKVNSNLAKIPPVKVKESPMKIYVPDGDGEKQYDDSGAGEQEYEDYGQDDMVSGENPAHQQDFGSRITPKRS